MDNIKNWVKFNESLFSKNNEEKVNNFKKLFNITNENDDKDIIDKIIYIFSDDSNKTKISENILGKSTTLYYKRISIDFSWNYTKGDDSLDIYYNDELILSYHMTKEQFDELNTLGRNDKEVGKDKTRYLSRKEFDNVDPFGGYGPKRNITHTKKHE